MSAPLSASDPGMRRVSVNSGTVVVDMVLPAGLSVAELIPQIVEILDGHGGDGFGDLAAKRYQLSLPGESALPASATMAQNGIPDGAILVLGQPATPIPAPRYDDVTDAVSATVDAIDRPWTRQSTQLTGAIAASCFTSIGCSVLLRNTFSNGTIQGGETAAAAALAGVIAMLAAVVACRVYRSRIAGLALNLIACGFAATAGFVAVPGAAGGPNALLAAVAAFVTSVLAMRVTGCGIATLTAVACFALVIAASALATVITAAPLPAISSVCALISLGLLGLAGRMSIALSGLSPQLPPPEWERLASKAIRADGWLTSLLAAFSASAAVGAVATALAGASRTGVAFAAIVGALLLLRTRQDTKRKPVFAISGICTTGATFVYAAGSAPEHGPWIAAATAALAAVSFYLGFVVPATSFSPVMRRGVDLLECLALVGIVPLTCWICGLYSAVRGLSPS